MSHSRQNHVTLTFVVRLWRETDAAGHAHWRGRVEHVGTQEVGYVGSVAGVAYFIDRWTNREQEVVPQIQPERSYAGDHGHPIGDWSKRLKGRFRKQDAEWEGAENEGLALS